MYKLAFILECASVAPHAAALQAAPMQSPCLACEWVHCSNSKKKLEVVVTVVVAAAKTAAVATAKTAAVAAAKTAKTAKTAKVVAEPPCRA